MRKKLLKIIAVLMILILTTMISSISFASSVTATNIKASLEKCLGQDILIKGSDNSKTILNGEASGMIVTDSKIIGKEGINEYNLFNYTVEDNVCTFNTEIEDFYKLMKIDTTKASKDDLSTSATLIAFMSYFYMQELYLSTADSIGKDLSLAYIYYQQQIESVTGNEKKIDINISNDIFSIVIKANDKNIIEISKLSVNLDNLANLNDSKINKNKTTYKVFIGELPDSEKEDISTEFKIDSIEDKAYTGKEIKPSINFLDKQNGFEAYINKESDCTVSYSNNINMGKATVTVKGIGFYKGTISKTFIIKPSKVKDLKASKQAKNNVTLNWSKNPGNVTGYKVYYYDYSKNKWQYSGKTTGSSYTVKGLKTATTYKFRVRAYKNIDGKQYFGSYSSSIRTSTKTKTPSLSKVISGSKKATVKFNKISAASGYQVQYSTDKNFKKNNKTSSVSKKSTSKTISKLKSKKKYYFRIRTYRTVDGKRVYGSYSNVKSIKVK